MILILIGKSGAGKDSIRDKLEKEGFQPIISATTRECRPSEADGKDYFFLSEEEFKLQVKSGQIFEHRKFESSNGMVYYGSKLMNLDPDKDYIKVLDPEGAKTYIENYGKQKCFVVEVEASNELRYTRAYNRQFPFNKPSEEELKAFNAEWQKRLDDDNRRFSGIDNETINYQLINETSMNSAVKDLMKAMNAFKIKMKEYTDIAHLHTVMVYPHLTVDRSFNQEYYAYTNDELISSKSSNHQYVEGLASLEQLGSARTYEK